MNKRTKEVAATLERMQRSYLHNINSDAIVVACLSALGTGEATPELLKALGRVQSAANALAANPKDDTLRSDLRSDRWHMTSVVRGATH